MKKPIVFFACLITLSFTLHSQVDTSLQWTPEFSMQFKSISSTDISPDGQYVAYVVREPIMEGEKSEYIQQIWVTSTDGKMNVQYTRAEKSSFAPAFSPDGQFIAFLSDRNEKNQVWIMRLMGGEAEQLTKAKNEVSSFKWSPDGSKIAFTMTDPDTEEEEKAKKEKRSVILVDQNFKYSHLYTIHFEKEKDGDRKVQRLTNGEFQVNSFDWSPDGKQIVFAHAPDPSINTNFFKGSDLSIISSDSSEVKALVSRPGNDGTPLFSPDGKFIVFQSDGGKPEPIGLSDLFIIPVAGGEAIPLPHSPDRNANIGAWSKNGDKVFFTEVFRTSGVLMASNIKNPGGLNAVKPSIISSQDGTSNSFSFSKKSELMAFVFQSLDKPAEVYLAKTDGTAVRQLSHINDEIKLPPMGKTEVVRWKSKDDLEIEGLLTYPVNYEEGKKYPIILQIHGGPAGVFTKSFTGNPSIYLTQYFAEQGFFIIRPNPRGSSGYGKEFRYANFKDWGFGDYEDIVGGVDYAINKGIADPNEQYVMGWSYGGYLTSYVVTKTDRFKAASMGAGLPNLISMVNTTDIPDYLVGHFGNEFWDDYDTYEKHSAMYHIKNVKTPTQIIHGENDLRVPFTQGQEFYVALKRRGVPTEMIVLPRTPHGPREPKLLMEVSPRILKWYQKQQEVKP